jgi:DNA-binding response OmpR family regulator
MEANVLLVDCVAAYRSLLAAKLGALGCAVFEAASGVEARRLLASRAFDVAIIDNCLADEDGLSLVSDLKSRGARTRFVVVVEPAVEPGDLAALAARIGAEAVIRGPVHPNAVIKAVRGLLGLRSSVPPLLGSTTSQPPPSDAPRPAGFGRVAALVASGDAELRDQVGAALRGRGFAVLAVGEAPQIPAALERLKPHVFILDSRLPEASGFDVCRTLKSADAWRGLAILLLVPAASPLDRAACFDAGADDFVEKPIVEAELLARAVPHAELGLLGECRPLTPPV